VPEAGMVIYRPLLKSNQAHSSSGLGHRPLKAEIRGSNPLCATDRTKPPPWWGFCPISGRILGPQDYAHVLPGRHFGEEICMDTSRLLRLSPGPVVVELVSTIERTTSSIQGRHAPYLAIQLHHVIPSNARDRSLHMVGVMPTARRALGATKGRLCLPIQLLG